MKYTIDISAAAGRKAVKHTYGDTQVPVVQEQFNKQVKPSENEDDDASLKVCDTVESVKTEE